VRFAGDRSPSSTNSTPARRLLQRFFIGLALASSTTAIADDEEEGW
jgi:hypothetical protein